jgi:probable rRNA maturation factor
MMEILIRNSQRLRVDRKRLLKTAVRLLKAEGCPESSEVSILLTDDAGISELNRQYRGEDRATDVLAFPMQGEVLGDVVISAETAKRQADERDKSLDDEIVLLLAHGILHLLGYTDDTDDEAHRMQQRAAEVIGAAAAR